MSVQLCEIKKRQNATDLKSLHEQQEQIKRIELLSRTLYEVKNNQEIKLEEHNKKINQLKEQREELERELDLLKNLNLPQNDIDSEGKTIPTFTMSKMNDKKMTRAQKLNHLFAIKEAKDDFDAIIQ
jgi:hypothetical protein